MRIVYAKFKGYIGFQAVMGLDELEIDFSNSTHKICLIVGMNGSGKSTLLSALNIFPDSSSSFVKNKDASKLLRLVDNDNLYEIEIISQYDGKGGRKTTKAFIRFNGEELNPNGNVSSYKEIVANEFELDSNFIGLSMMTSVDRGLGDKSPAERKKFVGNIIDNLVTYNDMYKNLNKKSLLYKSHINTLHTKIQSAGDKNNLESSLRQIELQKKNIEKEIEDLNYQIVYIQTKSEIDPEEAKLINEINAQKVELQSTIDSLQSSIDLFEHQTKIKPDNILESYEKDKELLSTYSKCVDDAVAEWKIKQEQVVQSSQTINQLKASIGDQVYDKQLENAYSASNNTLDNLKSELMRLHFSTKDVNKVDRLKDLIKSLNEITRRVDTFYDNILPEDIEYIVNEYSNTDIPKLQKDIEVLTNKIVECKVQIDEYNKDLRTLEVLDQRPNKCKINDCPFISEAYSLSKQTSQEKIYDELSKIQDEVLKTNNSIENLNRFILHHQELSSKAIEYQMIVNLIGSMDRVFDDGYYMKLINNEFSNINDKLIKGYLFNVCRAPQDFINGLNLLQEYDAEYRNNEILKAQYLSYVEKIKVVESTKKTIAKLEEESDELIKVVSNLKNKADSYTELVSQISKTIDIKHRYYDTVLELSDKTSQMEKLDIELQKFAKKSYESAKNLESINTLKIQIDERKKLLVPLDNQISDIKGRLTLLDSYYREYNQYKESYEFIEILKKYCSPTGGGIQTVFMQIYMSKTLELSNNILSMLFSGAYRLIDFVINQSEFRIPFIGPNGLPVDDISSGSNSQICMFGMVINLVLLHQASTKYNIAYLDEIDGGLDHRNRFEFTNALYNAIPILGIDQLFMISHSMEMDMSNVDIIKLKTYNDFEDTVDSGNIIFDYRSIVSK